MVCASKRKDESSDQIDLLLVFSRGAKTRIEILVSLEPRPRNCNQIAEAIKRNWWTVHKHIQLLEKAGLITFMSVGMIQFYRLTPSGMTALKLSIPVSGTNTVAPQII